VLGAQLFAAVGIEVHEAPAGVGQPDVAFR
jgi:hypothetical protein